MMVRTLDLLGSGGVTGYQEKKQWCEKGSWVGALTGSTQITQEEKKPPTATVQTKKVWDAITNMTVGRFWIQALQS